MRKDNSDTLFLGINLIPHDSTVFYYDLEKDDVFALSTERVTRLKHDGTSISPAINELMRYMSDMSYEKFKNIDVSIGYENDPFFNIDNLTAWRKEREINNILGKQKFKNNVRVLPNKFLFLLKSIAKLPDSFCFLKHYFLEILNKVFFTKKPKFDFSEKINSWENVFRYLKSDLRECRLNNITYNHYDHHECHCLGAYYFSGFDKCFSISLDHEGDNYFSKVYLCSHGKMTEISSSKVCWYGDRYITVGKIYEKITGYLGFVMGSDEGKVEALAAYGNYDNELYKKLLESTIINDNHEIIIYKDAIHYISNNYLGYIETMISKEDIAAAVQKYIEDVVVNLVQNLIQKYKVDSACFSGGCFGNVKLNMAVYTNTTIKHQYIIPAFSDSGVAIGALIKRLGDISLIDINSFRKKKFHMPYMGPEYTREEINSAIKLSEYNLNVIDLEDVWPDEVGQLIANGEIGAIYHGRAEFGPRALGNRSILADVRNPDSRDRLNNTIKGRPLFQPFCPSILEEDRNELFEDSYPNKHMTCAFKMKNEYALKYPAAVHIDGTARPQFVESTDNGNFYRVLKKIKDLIGHGIVINTSFNKHGRAMVLTPEHAIQDFVDSKMDFLCMDGYLIKR